MSAIPGADGIVGDLGGGSLELADIKADQVRSAISLPLGVLRVDDELGGRDSWRETTLRSALKRAGLGDTGAGRPFYMVGGSWRALARIDMIATNYPLPVKHQYAMPPARAKALRQMVASLDAKLRKVDRPGAAGDLAGCGDDPGAVGRRAAAERTDLVEFRHSRRAALLDAAPRRCVVRIR